MACISTRGRYATRMLVYLARQAGAGPIRKQRIALDEGLSPDYVEQIMIRLRAAGIVHSHRGREGGFSLAQDPDTLTVAAVLNATEGCVQVTSCGTDAPCARSGDCPTRALWQQANAQMMQLFSDATIGRLARAPIQPPPPQPLSYQI